MVLVWRVTAYLWTSCGGSPLTWSSDVPSAEANFPLDWETGPGHEEAGNTRQQETKDKEQKKDAMRQ